jgi:anti-sigma B factor antagonist
MEIVVTDLGTTARVALQGRLDTSGVERIEPRFTASAVPGGKHALVDLTGVTFMSSMGIRMLISVARALRPRNARMVIFGAQPMVRESLEHVALGTIIPMAADEAAAAALLGA